MVGDLDATRDGNAPMKRKGPAPQWSLGKSRYGYGPTGPLAGHARRVRQPARSGHPQLAGRRDAADIAHVDVDLRRPVS